MKGCKQFFSKTSNALVITIFIVFKQPLGEVVRFGRAATVLEAEMSDSLQPKSVADTIIQSVLSTPSWYPIQVVRQSWSIQGVSSKSQMQCAN